MYELNVRQTLTSYLHLCRAYRVALQDAGDRPHRLALLATCRQMHFETRALPFALNACRFASLYFLKNIIIRLHPHQRHAIRHVVITDRIWRSAYRFIESMRMYGHQDLGSTLPNIDKVEVDTHTAYKSDVQKIRDRQSVALAALVDWLRGSSGKIKIVHDEKEV
jgi:hypothetical protein